MQCFSQAILSAIALGKKVAASSKWGKKVGKCISKCQIVIMVLHTIVTMFPKLIPFVVQSQRTQKLHTEN